VIVQYTCPSCACTVEKCPEGLQTLTRVHVGLFMHVHARLAQATHATGGLQIEVQRATNLVEFWETCETMLPQVRDMLPGPISLDQISSDEVGQNLLLSLPFSFKYALGNMQLQRELKVCCPTCMKKSNMLVEACWSWSCAVRAALTSRRTHGKPSRVDQAPQRPLWHLVLLNPTNAWVRLHAVVA
jgi:hypothetical protein